MDSRSMPAFIEELGKLAFKLQGHDHVQGLDIAIENRKGSVRKGVDRDGKPWRTVMKHPYGYLKGTKGKDGEEIDVYVGPHKDAPIAHVVHQHKADGTGHDEDKVMLGFKSKAHARSAYLAHYNDPKFLGPISSIPVEEMKRRFAEGKRIEKLAGRKLILQELGAIANRLHGSPGILDETRKAVSSGNVKALKELTRGNLLNSAVEVPFSNRLKVYKEWKATGNVPRVDRRGNIVHQPDLFHYEHSTDPVTVVHGGGSNSIERMISSGARGGEQHGPYLIPGQTHAQRYSTYTFEVPKDEQGAALARRHASGYAFGAEGPKTDAYQGAPAVVESVLPKKNVLFSKNRWGSREVIVPSYGSLGSLSYGRPTVQPAAALQKTSATKPMDQRLGDGPEPDHTGRAGRVARNSTGGPAAPPMPEQAERFYLSSPQLLAPAAGITDSRIP